MRRTVRILCAVLLVGVMLGQALHRHTAHDGGVSAPHTDCTLCGWSRNGSLPVLQTGPAGFLVALLLCLMVLGGAVCERAPRFSVFLSRAPPAPSR